MLESIDKVMLAGLGALSMTRDRAEKIFDEYVERGKAAKENRGGFVRDMMDRAEKSRAELEKIVANQVHKAVEKLDLATASDVRRVEEKLDRLLARK
jgi:polyhydroxyalkanoate synthesis regulator phasin